MALAAGTFAAEVRVTDRTLPFVQDGGGSSTSVTIVNLESTQSTFEVLFLTDTGAYWILPVTGPSSLISDGAYARGKLEPGGSITFATNGVGRDIRSGHARIFSIENARLGVDISINSEAGAVHFNAATEREDTLILPFDNTGGASTAFLWVSDTPFSVVSYRAVTEEGAEVSSGRYQFSVSDDRVQTLFYVAERMPETAGKRGTVQLQIDYPDAGIYDELFFTGLAIQTDSKGARVVRSSMSSGSWKASRH